MALRADLAAACVAAGVPLRDGPQGDAATAMLLSPWAPIARPRAGRPLLVRLCGPPTPATATFASPPALVDLADLGSAAAALDGFPRATARAGMGGRKSASPARG